MAALRRCPVLVERDEELRVLSQLASEVSSGGARVVVLTGEAGAGKSRLAQEFVGSLPEQWRARTLRVTRAGAAMPTLPDERPLALVLDDAHFLDPVALGELPGLLDDLGRQPVLALLTFRLGFHRTGSAEMRSLARLVRDPRALELRVMPLSAAGVSEMAAAMGRYVPEDLHARTGGNPFWAEELLHEEAGLPWTVVESVLAQLEALPHDARELAHALALAREPLPLSSARELVAGLDAASRALLDTGLGEKEGDALALRHALVGEAIEGRLGPGEVARWHGRLAAALQAHDADVDRVARHWAAAGEATRAAALARSTASVLRANGATRRAFNCFELALARPPDDPLAAAQLYEEGALTAARVGEYESMRGWIEAAERLYREAGQPDRAVRMVLDPSLDYLPIKRSERIRDEPVERLLLEAREAVRSADLDHARAMIETAVEAARARGDGMALGRAARMMMHALGEFDRGEALAEEAARFADVAAHPGRRSRMLTIQAASRMAQGLVQDSLELTRRAVAISRQEREAVYRVGEIARGDALLVAGRIHEAASMLTDAAGRVPWAEHIATIADGGRRFEHDDPTGIDQMLAGTETVLDEVDFDPLGLGVVGGHLLRARALAEVHGERYAAAVRTVDQVDAMAPEAFGDTSSDLAYVLARAGYGLRARNLLIQARRRLDELTRVCSGPGVIGAAEAVRGFAALAEDRGQEAARHFTAAAEHFERAPRWTLAAEAWCDAAAAAGPGQAASAALERAPHIASEFDLTRLGRRARELRQHLAGEPGQAPGRLAELTLREREVVALAAEGLSNREIGARLYLSEGTVRNYLSNAFAKLGVARRAELGRLLAAVPLHGDRVR